MKTASSDQIKKIWSVGAYAEMDKSEIRGVMEEKTGKKSAKELTEREANKLIYTLTRTLANVEDQRRPMRSKILHLCRHCFGWDLSEGSDDWNRFNSWMRHKSVHKKFLTSHTRSQLVDTINQLEKIKSRM